MEFKTQNGTTLIRVSRWIRIRQNYNPNKRNSLWYYVKDGNGWREGQPGYDPESGLFLDYFRFNGRNYALEQFISNSSAWGYPIFFEDENGKTSFISGYDSENYVNPLLIELDDCCEYVRCYYERG